MQFWTQELGQFAYEKHVETMGETLPTWEMLIPEEQMRWNAIAKAVVFASIRTGDVK